jgi:hypothetical protein
MGSDERDQQFERALGGHLRGAAQDDACPDPETLAAYHERMLSLEEMARWKEHIAGCARCQEALALVEQSEMALAEGWQNEQVLANERGAGAVPLTAAQAVPAQEAAGTSVARAKITEIRKPAALKRWTVPIGAIAAALLVWIGWHELRMTPQKKASSVQVAENRGTPPPPQPERAAPMNGRAIDSVGELAPGAPAPTRAPKMHARSGQGGEVGGGTGGGFAKEAPLAESGTGAAVDAGQDAKNYESGRLSAKTAPSPVAAPLPPPPSAGAMAHAPANKGATGGPLVKNQMDQSQANQTQANQVQTSPNSELAKKEEGQKQELQKRKDLAVTESVEVSAMSTAATTTNGPISLRDVANITPSVIVAPDNKNAWRVGTSGKVEHSGNGGSSWKAQTSGVTQDLLAGMAVSKKICWVVGKNGTILLTTDGGRHWGKILSPIKGDLGGVHAQDEQHASIWDVANREAYETSDGGATWKSTANE